MPDQPMQRRILLVLDYRGLFRQDISRNHGIRTETMIDIFRKSGFEVVTTTYDELVNGTKGVNSYISSFVVYTGSESMTYKSYIEDVAYLLGRDNVLLPSYELLKAHEDKLFAQLLLDTKPKPKASHALPAIGITTYADLLRHLKDLEYPVVVKSAVGSGSIGVRKADSEAKLKRIFRQMASKEELIMYYLKYLYKRLQRKDLSEYIKDEKWFGKVLLQRYVPDMEDDWKVLAFGEKFYVLNRKVRKNDFRASGSGIFLFNKAPRELLDAADECYRNMDVPILSMDFCMDRQRNVYLIEYQSVHFGPYTLIKSESYYVKDSDGWREIRGKSDLATEYALAIVGYIERKHFAPREAPWEGN